MSNEPRQFEFRHESSDLGDVTGLQARLIGPAPWQSANNRTTLLKIDGPESLTRNFDNPHFVANQLSKINRETGHGAPLPAVEREVLSTIQANGGSENLLSGGSGIQDLMEADNLKKRFCELGLMDESDQLHVRGVMAGYYVDLDERGDFQASVRGLDDTTIFSIPDMETLQELRHDGFMNDQADVGGLESYLRERNVVQGEEILPMSRFEDQQSEMQRQLATLLDTTRSIEVNHQGRANVEVDPIVNSEPYSEPDQVILNFLDPNGAMVESHELSEEQTDELLKSYDTTAEHAADLLSSDQIMQVEAVRYFEDQVTPNLKAGAPSPG